MRMNSSAYMNDPYEGESLYDLLGIQEPDLENLSESNPYNAFFACFSSRVNDLNQFRLYGKVGNVEASGCCLVFNRRGNWIREPDIDASYRRLNEQGVITGNDMKTAVNAQRQPENLPLFKMEVAKAPRPSENLSLYQVGAAIKAQRPSENLPLYQIAYIFYRDEYTQNDEYENPKKTKPHWNTSAICLKTTHSATKKNSACCKSKKSARTKCNTAPTPTPLFWNTATSAPSWTK